MPFPETDQQQIQTWMTSLQDEQKRKQLIRNSEQTRVLPAITPTQTAPQTQDFVRRNNVPNSAPLTNTSEAARAYGFNVAQGPNKSLMFSNQSTPPDFSQPLGGSMAPNTGLDPEELAQQFNVRAKKQPNGTWSFTQ